MHPEVAKLPPPEVAKLPTPQKCELSTGFERGGSVIVWVVISLLYSALITIHQHDKPV